MNGISKPALWKSAPWKYAVVAVFTLLFLPLTAAFATDTDKNGDDDRRRPVAGRADMMPGRVMVKFKERVDLNVQSGAGAAKTGMTAVDFVMQRFSVHAIEKAFSRLDGLSAGKKASLKGIDHLQRIYRVGFDDQQDPRMVAAMLERLPEVEYAEPVYLDYTTDMRTSDGPASFAWFDQPSSLLAEPNDPRFGDQIYFDRFFIQEAWDVVKGESGNVVVAVIDGGTDWTHEDMQANLWVSPGEIADNGLDDDGNGFEDDTRGWNFGNNSNDPKGLTNMPSNAQHGTQTAGLIGAQTNNGTGIAGTSWNATYLPINITCNDLIDGQESLCYSLEAYEYALLADVDIINASFGSPFRSDVVQDMITTLHENGTLVIAAAGNDNRNNNDLSPYYPASYNHVLSVGATSRNGDGLTSFTHVGVSVDVFAPGTAILSTSPFNGYLTNTGTSFSAPIVAGVAALVKTQNPTWGPDQVREQVRSTADDITGVNSTFVDKIGKGRVNALRAVTESTSSIRIVSTDVRDASGSSRIDAGELATVTMEVTNFLEQATNINITLETDVDGVTIPQSTATIGTLNQGDTTTVEFSVRPAFDVAQNLQTVFVTKISADDGYTDIDAFSTLLNSTSHDTGNIQVTLTDQGNIGYEGFAGQSPGNGFRYLDFDFLFEGGLVTGNGVNTLSDNVRGENDVLQDDFVQIPGTDFGIIDGRVTKEEGALQIEDTDAETPLQTRIRLDSFADTSAAYRDFVVMKYSIENAGSESISNYYAGLYFDWDSFDDPASDHARYDASRNMGYFLNSVPEMADVFLGTKLLTDQNVNFRAINNSTDLYGSSGTGEPSDGFTNSKKWEYLSGGIQTQSLDNTDISVILSAGPFDIAAGESIEIAFALIGGTTLGELETSADAAQSLWENTLAGLSPNPVANESPAQPAFTFGLAEPYPNPVSQEATIDFGLEVASEVQVKIYDVLGREVKTLLNAPHTAGKHSISWDGTDNAGVRIASGLYMITLNAPTPEGLKSDTRKVVVLR